jgi:hypothetical protein
MNGPKKAKPRPGELAYFIALFKLDGHDTWRACLGRDKNILEREKKNWGKNPPKVTKSKLLRIDRMTAEIHSIHGP